MARRANIDDSAEEAANGRVADRGQDKAAVSSPPQSTKAPPKLTPEARAKLYAIRGRIEVAVGQMVLLMMQSPRYRHQSLADLNNLVVEPLLRDRLSIAHAKRSAEDSEQPVAIGAALWATVDDAVDRKIEEQVKAGVFPVRLAPEELTSGDKLWLLDIVAVDRKAATAVLLNFRKIAGERPVRIHPLVARSVDPEVLKKLRRDGPDE